MFFSRDSVSSASGTGRISLPAEMPSWLQSGLAEYENASAQRAWQLLDRLATDHGEDASSVLLHHLCGYAYPPDHARRLLISVLAHRDDMARRLDRFVPIRTAVIDHFITAHGLLADARFVCPEEYQRIRREAVVDPLTRLANRRAWELHLDTALALARRQGDILSLALIDLDDFKRLNDRHGHDAGDRALVKFARCLLCSLRTSDFAARWGGEEFALLLPSTSRAGTVVLLERMRACLASQASSLFPTFSAGVATFPEDGAERAALFSAADRALALAKTAGKNRVIAHQEERRVFVRTPLRHPVRVIVDPGMSEGDTMTVDIGAGGISFEWTQALPQAAAVSGSLRLGEHQAPFVGRVVRTDGSEPTCRVAVHFDFIRQDDRARLESMTAIPGTTFRPAEGH